MTDSQPAGAADASVRPARRGCARPRCSPSRRQKHVVVAQRRQRARDAPVECDDAGRVWGRRQRVRAARAVPLRAAAQQAVRRRHIAVAHDRARADAPAAAQRHTHNARPVRRRVHTLHARARLDAHAVALGDCAKAVANLGAEHGRVNTLLKHARTALNPPSSVQDGFGQLCGRQQAEREDSKQNNN
eukprot:365244-Chlamydomonas_euryale.AAC.18